MNDFDHERSLEPRLNAYAAQLNANATRLVLWSAGARLMANTPGDRQIGGEYLGSMLDHVERLENVASANNTGRPLVFTLGNVMGMSAMEMRRTHSNPEPGGVDVAFQAATPDVEYAMNVVQEHVVGAYAQYHAYETAQLQDPTQTDVKWY